MANSFSMDNADCIAMASMVVRHCCADVNILHEAGRPSQRPPPGNVGTAASPRPATTAASRTTRAVRMAKKSSRGDSHAGFFTAKHSRTQ